MIEFSINQPPPTKGQIDQALSTLKSKEVIFRILGVFIIIIWVVFSWIVFSDANYIADVLVPESPVLCFVFSVLAFSFAFALASEKSHNLNQLIKSYIKSVTVQDPPRTLVIAEYKMLTDYDENYDNIKASKKACEAICSGEL